MAAQILIADDEQPVLDELEALLRADARVGQVHRAASGTQALLVLGREQIDVALLDIHMPGLDGLELAHMLGRFQHPPAVVFVTADDMHAVDAFDLAAVDYLLKPVRPARLRTALDRALAASGPVEAADADETIPVTVGDTTRFLRRSDVRWAQADGDYTRLWTATGGHLVREPISHLADRWEPHGFVRIHRSYLVHRDAIVQARLGGAAPVIVLAEVELPVSRRLAASVRDKLAHP